MVAPMLSQRTCPLTAHSAAAHQSLLLARSAAVSVGTTRQTVRRQLRTYAVEEQKDQAQQSSAPKPDIAKFSDNIGLPTDEGIFGFKPFPEVWVGRLAMAGFVTSCVVEFQTGKGTLQQLGLYTPNDALFYTTLALSTGASVFAFGRTLSRALTGNMSKTELKRYGRALGLSDEASQISETETEMKSNWQGKPDTPPSSLTGSGSDNPTDTFQNEQAQSPAKPAPLPEDTIFVEPSERYARNVEIQNGRAAMIGFLGSTVVEAATGKGILSQVLWYFKLVNILGPASGF
ncbi:hypothetical protein WJX73_007227 [Symbiochloris irregularis]|uniref:Uncharacterized protein n=1 Tax=Symbiochloris irregularis TaxID=706552 RepID=A0AAW1P1D1_9CHLO